MNRLERYRNNRNQFFQTHEDSPLEPEQRERFRGLDYFPESPDLRFELPLDRDSVGHEHVELETTTGEYKHYVPAGRLQLTIAGQPVQLLLFKEAGRGRYFLPFRDATAGAESYKLGRYLDPQETPRGTVVVDFNYAYNPYCAYNERWSCPIPPPENHVAVPIRAGEKLFRLEEPAT